ncbi:9292_t:CDS:2 [Gigaspora margarita]|uniref:9292_t:CDS:1 n=1 Tax=Gigaspora margarita TaxID=4874 RepID=A0ABN7V1V2_GIGMA|nr:9292_t:CDS:2 [Gigaspora margarita]
MFLSMMIIYALIESIKEIANSIEYVKDDQICKKYSSVILATNGYIADFTEDSLIKKKATYIEKVQIYSIRLVDPKEPDAKNKFLATEDFGVSGPVHFVLNSKALKEIE